MRMIVMAGLTALLLAGCAGDSGGRSPRPASNVQALRFEPPARPEESRLSSLAEAQSPRRLIRTVDLELRVDDTDKVAKTVEELVGSLGGYVSGIDAYLQEGLRHAELSVKIPVHRLEEALTAFRALAVDVQREHLRTEDVTDRFVDLEARLRTLQATETELQALLAESQSRGHKAEDIMAVYRHLTEIRTDIEQSQAKLNALVGLTTYSSINLQLVPTEAARPFLTDRWKPAETLRSSSRALVATLRVLVDAAIFTFVVILPVFLLAALPLTLAVKGWRRARRRLVGRRQSEEGGEKRE